MFIDIHKLPEEVRAELDKFLKEETSVNFSFELEGEASGLPMIKVGSSVIPSEPRIPTYSTHGFAYPTPGPVQMRMSHRTTLHSDAALGFLGGFPRYSFPTTDDALFIKHATEALAFEDWKDLSKEKDWSGYDKIWLSGNFGERIPEGAWYIMSDEGLSLAYKTKKMIIGLQLSRRIDRRTYRTLPKRGLANPGEDTYSFEVSFMPVETPCNEYGYSQRMYLSDKWQALIDKAESDGEGLLEIARLAMDNLEQLASGEDLESLKTLRKEFDAHDAVALTTENSLFVASNGAKLMMVLYKRYRSDDPLAF